MNKKQQARAFDWTFMRTFLAVLCSRHCPTCASNGERRRRGESCRHRPAYGGDWISPNNDISMGCGAFAPIVIEAITYP
jgi:hypothetical protein